MLCAKCEHNHANIHLHLNINGQKQTLPLCSNCYSMEKNKLGASMSGSLFGSDHSLEDMFKQQANNPLQNNQQKSNASEGAGFLDQYGRNLNNAAIAGLIDPVIG